MTGGVGMTWIDAVCQKAVGSFRRRGLSSRIRRVVGIEDLLSIGRIAVLENGTQDEGLAVTVAHAAMADAIKAEKIRQRGAVEIREGHTFTGAGEEPSVGDMWDAIVYGHQHIQPAARYYDLWEELRALSPREYRVIALTFWSGMTLHQVAAELGVSHMTVSRILTRVINMLREQMLKTRSSIDYQYEGGKRSANRPFGRKGGGLDRKP